MSRMDQATFENMLVRMHRRVCKDCGQDLEQVGINIRVNFKKEYVWYCRECDRETTTEVS